MSFLALGHIQFLYAASNLVKLDLFIDCPFTDEYERQEKTSAFSFVGSIGGILGLFMGFSLISLAEVGYFFARHAARIIGKHEVPRMERE